MFDPMVYALRRVINVSTTQGSGDDSPIPNPIATSGNGQSNTIDGRFQVELSIVCVAVTQLSISIASKPQPLTASAGASWSNAARSLRQRSCREVLPQAHHSQLYRRSRMSTEHRHTAYIDVR